MKKAVVAFVVLVLMAGAGFVAMPFAEGYAARRIKAELAAGAVQVDSVKVDFLTRSVALDGMTGPNGDVKIGSWKAEGLAWPFDELMRGRTPLHSLGWGDPFRAARLHLQDVHVAIPDEGGAWTIKEMVATDIDLPRYDAIYEGPYRNHVMTARLLRALSVRQIEQVDVSHVSIDELVIAARKLVIEDYAQGSIGKFDVDGFEGKEGGSPTPELGVAEVRASGVDLRRAMDVASSIDWEPGTPVGRIPFVLARLSGFGGSLMARYGLSLGAITIETTRESADVSRTQTRVEGFVLAPSLRSMEALAVRMVLQAMGLDAVRLELDCQGMDDRTRQEITVDECKLSGAELAEVSATIQIVNVDDDFWQAVDENDGYALLGSKASLGAAKLVIADKSLLQRSLQAKAKFAGTQATAERAQLAEDIRRYQPEGVLISQDLTKLLDTVARFVEQGGTLTLQASPQPAIGLDKLEYLAKPGADLVNALGLTATLSR